MPRPYGIRLGAACSKSDRAWVSQATMSARFYLAQRVRHAARSVSITQGLLRKMLPSTRRGSVEALADTYTTGNSARDARNAAATSHPVIPVPRRTSVTKTSISVPLRKKSSALSPELASMTVQPAASNSSTKSCRSSHSSSTKSTTRDNPDTLKNPDPAPPPKSGASCLVRRASNVLRSVFRPTCDGFSSFFQRVDFIPGSLTQPHETFSSLNRCLLVTFVTGAGVRNSARIIDCNPAQPKGELPALPNREL